jgi:ATP synthase F1 complex assembly factor 2
LILSILCISAPKRFYRKTGILNNDGKFEITLDQRKLKSPKGSPFIVHSEPLALAVAAEWDAQKEKIQQSSMHLVRIQPHWQPVGVQY